jgi:hypothetical protein
MPASESRKRYRISLLPADLEVDCASLPQHGHPHLRPAAH